MKLLISDSHRTISIHPCMMKKVFLQLSFFVLAVTCLNAHVRSNDNEQSKVNQIVTRFFDGMAELDPDKIKSCITNDFLLLEDGVIWNMDTIVTKLNQRKGASFSRINHLDFFQTEVYGNRAWTAYNNEADITFNGQKRNVQWMESAVLVKEGEHWKIRMLHSTRLKPKGQ